ncbi:MAG TPA: TIGR00269 family protein [Candidatus Bathyarchaeia archaeon]|nr:TIGR00269 family protein [Candidatus Bathyarchaeia archaeon]
MPERTCSFCSESAIYTKEYEGASFCGRCFRHSLEERVRRTVTKHDMLAHNDHIAVAVSGGKDSLTLLTLLVRMEQRFPYSKITAVSVDEGIEGYRDEALQIASETCRKLNVNQHVVSYKDLFGITTDTIVKEQLGKTPCSYCGVLRRKAINKAASTIGATKIATAHNLDDEVQTVLLNMLHGDPMRIIRSGPVLQDSRGRFITRIKPFCNIPEKEIVLYAYLTGLEFQTVACPHGNEALRNDIRNFLNQMEQKHVGTKFTLQKTAQKLREQLSTTIHPLELQDCEKCGDPTPHRLCEACIMLESIRPQPLVDSLTAAFI